MKVYLDALKVSLIAFENPTYFIFRRIFQVIQVLVHIGKSMFFYTKYNLLVTFLAHNGLHSLP